MKELYSNLFKLILIWLLAIFIIASCGRSAYAVDLSKSVSVTPQRHCGFIVPKICIGSQSMHIHSTSVSATQTRLKSLYEGMTLQNKPLGEYAGRFCITESEPRHPLRNFRSVALSQNHTGGHNRA